MQQKGGEWLAVYLIDYENVNKDGLNGVSKLTEKDKVIIFYSARADRMTFGLHRRLNETLATVEYKRVDVGGHNALDFQLATYLGFLLAKDSSEEYCIVSNDRGFEYLAGFWRRPLYNVTRTREIATSPQAEERRQQRKQDREDRAEFSFNEDYNRFEEADEGADDQRPEKRVEVPEESERTDLLVIETASGGVPARITPADQEIMETESLSDRPASLEEPDVDTDHSAPAQETDLEDRENPMTGNLPEDQGEMEAASDGPAGEPEENARDDASGDRQKTQDSRKKSSSRRRAGRNQKRTQRGETKPEDPHARKLTDSVEECVSGLELEESDRGKIADYIERYKTKLGLNNALVRQFGTQKAGEIYKMIKPLIRDKKGSVEEKTPSPEEEKLSEDVKKMTAGMDLTEDDLKEITSSVRRYKTRQGVNNALVRRFRSQKAGEIYKMIKPLLKEKKGRNNQ